MILIYCPEVTSRVVYIFNFIFRDILLTEVQFTEDVAEFRNYPGVKFTYGHQADGINLFFKAHRLLFEKEIVPQAIEFAEWKNQKVFFPVEESAIPFDPFAASFYLVTRYEEYLPHHKDHYYRFRPEESAAWKGSFLERPVVNIWAEELKNILRERFPDLNFPSKSFRFIPTIDIDNAYAFKYKGFLRNTFRLMTDLLSLEFRRSLTRVKVLSGMQKDPYDSYHKIQKINEKYNLKTIFFFLIGDPGKHDRNFSHTNTHFRLLIRSVQSFSQIGIHPSYGSNKNTGQVLVEKQRLEEITNETITRSRQHYIKLTFPDTYRNLISAGITEDYSMGYPSVCGFRASCCTPFYFYDLEKEETTGLKVHSFVFMDTTLKVYLKKRSTEVIPFVSPFIQQIKKTGGELIYIFHNESIGTGKMWKNWESMYEDIIKSAMKD
jgi:hypothetical protein